MNGSHMYQVLAVLLASIGNAATLPDSTTLSLEAHIAHDADRIRDQDAQHYVKLNAVYHERNLRGLIRDDVFVGDSLQRGLDSYSADVSMFGSNALLAYVTEVTLGSNATFKLVIDTGSSDTWIIKKKFECIDLDSEPRENDFCKLGPGYQPSSTFVPMDDFHFNTKYADGEKLFGVVGTEKVKVGTLTVPDQRFNLVDRAAWLGDGQTSGLLGLGLPANTANFRGTNQSDRSRPVRYDPFFTTALKAGLVPSGSFSIALQRDLNTTAHGYLSFGGLPPVRTFGKSVSIQFSPHIRSSSGQTDYVVPIDGFIFPTSVKLKTRVPIDALIDSGTSMLIVPPSVEAAYNALWNPNTQEAPPFSVLINGTEFPLDPKDLKFATQTGFASAVYAGRSTILGGTFMRNVVSTFDVVGQQMRFSSTNPRSGPEQRLQL